MISFGAGDSLTWVDPRNPRSDEVFEARALCGSGGAPVWGLMSPCGLTASGTIRATFGRLVPRALPVRMSLCRPLRMVTVRCCAPDGRGRVCGRVVETFEVKNTGTTLIMTPRNGRHPMLWGYVCKKHGLRRTEPDTVGVAARDGRPMVALP